MSATPGNKIGKVHMGNHKWLLPNLNVTEPAILDHIWPISVQMRDVNRKLKSLKSSWNIVTLILISS